MRDRALLRRIYVILLTVAGNETTTGLVVNTARVFAEFPHVLPAVKEDPALIS